MGSRATRAKERRRGRAGGGERSPACESPEWCPGYWPEDPDDLPCWDCYRDRCALPVLREGGPCDL